MKAYILIILLIFSLLIFGCTSRPTAINDVKSIVIIDANGFMHNITLNDLNDVNVDTVVGGDALVFNALSGLWEPGTLTSNDIYAKISATDTTTNYLEQKLAAGSNIIITKINTGANEQLRIDSNSSGADTNCAVPGSCTYLVYANDDINRLKNYVRYDGNLVIPTQVGQSGKYLKTNGTTVSWETISTTDTNWETSWDVFDANMKATYLNGKDASDVLSIDEDNRILYGSDGTTELIKYGELDFFSQFPVLKIPNGIYDGNGQILWGYPSYERHLMGGEEIWANYSAMNWSINDGSYLNVGFPNGRIMASDATMGSTNFGGNWTASISPNERILYASDGTSSAINYQSDVIISALDISTAGGPVEGATTTLGSGSTNGLGEGGSVIFSGGRTYDTELNNEYEPAQISLQGGNRNTASNGRVSIYGDTYLISSEIVDSSTYNNSIDPNNRILYASDGFTQSVDYENYWLNVSTGPTTTLDWFNNNLTTTGGNSALNWGVRKLYAEDGVTPNLDWNILDLNGAWTRNGYDICDASGNCPSGGTDTNEFTAGNVDASGVRLTDFNFGGKSIYNALDVNTKNLVVEGTGYTNDTIGDPQNVAGTINYGSGNYTAEGASYTIYVYAYKTVNGVKIFSATPGTTTVVDDESYNSLNIDWSWDAVAEADGYRVQSTYSNIYQDVVGTSVNDDGTYGFYPQSGVTWISAPIPPITPSQRQANEISLTGDINTNSDLITLNANADITISADNRLFVDTKRTDFKSYINIYDPTSGTYRYTLPTGNTPTANQFLRAEDALGNLGWANMSIEKLGSYSLRSTLGSEGDTGEGVLNIGYNAGSRQVGGYNVWLGYYAGNILSGGDPTNAGSHNIGIGGFNQNGDETDTGGSEDNISIGYYAGNALKGSSRNTLLGVYAGKLLDGNNNVFIGFKSGSNRTSDNNILIIHNQDTGSAANDLTKSLIYGKFDANTANQQLTINGNVGIGTTTPKNKLNVIGDINATTNIYGNQLYDSNLTSGRVVFSTTGGQLADDSNLYWDNTNKRLGINTTASDGYKLSVLGSTVGNKSALKVTGSFYVAALDGVADSGTTGSTNVLASGYGSSSTTGNGSDGGMWQAMSGNGGASTAVNGIGGNGGDVYIDSGTGGSSGTATSGTITAARAGMMQFSTPFGAAISSLGASNPTITTGAGGDFAITVGNGGTGPSSGTTTGTSTGGNAGNITITGGNGAIGRRSTTSNFGGTGTTITFTAGAGGAGNSGTGVNGGGTGGNAGSIVLSTGNGGLVSNVGSSYTGIGGRGGNFTIQLGSGGGAITNIAGNATGGRASGITITGGSGGAATSSAGNATGGGQGYFYVPGMNGGNATANTAGKTAIGGEGSYVFIASGNGGSAGSTSGSSTGGIGGNFTIVVGKGGTATGASPTNGANGNILFKLDTTEIARFDNNASTGIGNFGIGTSTPLFKLDVNGTGRFKGDVNFDGNVWFNDTYWDDISIPIGTSGKPGSKPPVFDEATYAYGFEDQAVALNEQYAFASAELPHGWKLDTNIHCHIHAHPSTTNVGDYNFELCYKWTNIGAVEGSAECLTVKQTTDGTANKIFYTEWQDINGVGKTLSSTLEFKLKRLSAAASDTFTGTVYVDSLGCHYESDAPGSRTELVK